MSIIEFLQISTKWLAWLGLALSAITLIAFLIKWGIRFRLVGTTIFTFLLCGSCFAFLKSYTPPKVVEGAKYAPIVFDNGKDLVIAKASKDFSIESIRPTLQQLAGNIKGGERNGAIVHIRLRQIVPVSKGISKPVILGEVIKDQEKETYIDLESNQLKNET